MAVYNSTTVRPDSNTIEIKSGGTLLVESGGILNLASGALVKAAGTQASHIADAAVAAGAAPDKAEFDAVVTKLNAVLKALEDVGVLKKS